MTWRMLFFKIFFIPVLLLVLLTSDASYKIFLEKNIFILALVGLYILTGLVPIYLLHIFTFVPLELVLKLFKGEKYIIILSPILGIVLAKLIPLSELSIIIDERFQNFIAPGCVISGILWSLFTLFSYFTLYLGNHCPWLLKEEVEEQSVVQSSRSTTLKEMQK